MKKILACTLVAFLSSYVNAQQQTYDIVSFVVPKGWQKESDDYGMRLYTQDKNTGAYAFILIFKSAASNETPNGNFNKSWQQLMKGVMSVKEEPKMLLPFASNGWDIISGWTDFSDANNNKNYARLVTATGNSVTTSMVLMTNADSYQDVLQQFVNEAGLTRSTVKPPRSASTSKTEVPAKKLPASTNNAGKNIKYEVWEMQSTNISTLKLELKTVVLSPDGKCMYYMPEKGLNGVTPENSNETGSWGTVTDKGNMLSLINPKYGNIELYKVSTTSMSRYPGSKTAIYKKCKPVDGLRFEGAYSPQTEYYTGKETIISKQIVPGKRPIIFFKKDGTYINEGIAFSNLTYGDDFAIGIGTYEIINYSLMLTTQSGRKLQVAFTPVLDGGTTVNDGFIINNSLYYRLGKQYQPQ